MRTQTMNSTWLALLALAFLSVVPALAAEGPTLKVTVDKPVIQADGKAIIHWTSVNAKYCHMSHGIGLLKREGTVEVSPSQTTTYTLTAFGTKWRSSLDEAARKEQETIATITVRVDGAPPQVSFASDTFTIYQGDSVELSWIADNAVACSITPGIGAVTVKGRVIVRPDKTTEYVITANGPGGEARSAVTVTVHHRVNP